MQPNTQTHPSEGVAAQLRDLDRQGGGMARMAHAAATALLVAFSLGSLITLSYAALQEFIGEWNRGIFDVVAAVSLAVSLLLVISMDIAMLYAASVMRMRASTGASWREFKTHIAFMAGACILESLTYWYMIVRFDNPASKLLAVIAIGRALAAPLYASYLSMARPLPVTPEDVAYQTSLHSGHGLIRDVAHLAANPDAPLHRKVRIYKASSRMTPQAAAQFAGIIEAVSEDAPAAIVPPLEVAAPVAPQGPTRPPTGPGSPTARPRELGTASGRSARHTAPAVVSLEARRPARSARSNGRQVRTAAKASAEAKVRRAWRPDMSVSQLEREAGVARSTAAKWARILEAEAASSSSADGMAQ